MYSTCPSCHRPYISKGKGSPILILYLVAVLLLFIPAAITRETWWALLIVAGMCGFVPMSLLNVKLWVLESIFRGVLLDSVMINYKIA